MTPYLRIITNYEVSSRNTVASAGAPDSEAGFQVYVDDEAPQPAAPRAAKVYRAPANDENRPPAELRPRAKTYSQAAAVFTDKENQAPAARPPLGAASCSFQAAAGAPQQPAGRQPLAARPDPERPARAQQRKQKLRQRPLEEQQHNTKRAALQPLPVVPPAGRLPCLFSIYQDPEPAGAAAAAPATAWPAPPDVHEALLRPAPSASASAAVLEPAVLYEAPMASPESLHSSLDSISISPRRGRLDALFSYEEYAADLYLIMRQLELEHRARPDFMSRQPDITVTMRSILVDWLVEVNDEYKLNSETLHLAVNYIDRFLSVMTVVRAKLQLVGTTALFIASKFEEIYPPTVKEFVYITDDTYTDTQLKRMEHVMLKMLAFDMSAPTSNWFLNYFIDNGGAGEDTVRHLAQFLVELTLVQYPICNKYVSSVQAASALCVARFCCGHVPWTPALERLTGLGREQLRPCVQELVAVYQMARDLPQQAVIDKFSKDKFLSVAQLEPPAAFVWD
ncbi:G2/mitotic-specific cyclin-A [Amphibalanus amphitrite]|uniref:G2/mitotic-specific cyclin-A n=1 Tax=Amphibalanus amphitrite TaxID=1232801 RepID=A0A6A4VEW1_AMPAM|nr:G2/mitotic-specific cyclin-A [Amphibalanus amphitrite]